MKMGRGSLLIAVLLLVSNPAIADVAEHARKYAVYLKQMAETAVTRAQIRLKQSQENLEDVRATETTVAGSRDSAAIAMAHEAVAEANLGVQQSRQLLDRARALLARREQQLRDAARVQSLGQDTNSQLRGVMFSLDGQVMVFDAKNRPVRDPFRLLQPGDHVVTGKDGHARLILANGDADVQLNPGSDMQIAVDDATASLEAYLAKGFGYIRKKVQSRLQKLEVRTPAVVVAARATEFSVQVLVDGVRVGVSKGRVAITPSAPNAEPIELSAGNQREWTISDGWGPLRPLDAIADRVEWDD